MLASGPTRILPSGAEAEPAAGLSLLGALVVVARQYGLQLAVPQLVHDHLLQPGQPSVPELLKIAEREGMRASSTRLAWDKLDTLAKTLPAIVMLRNGNAMVLRRVDLQASTPHVVLQDPNAHADA